MSKLRALERAFIAPLLCCLAVTQLASNPPAPVESTDETEASTEACASETELALGEDDRAFLWQAEHAGTVLGEFGFKRMAQALADADGAALRALLAPGFAARIPANPRRIVLDSEDADVERLEPRDDARQSLDAAGFVEWMLRQRRQFDGSPQVKIKLTSMSPLAREAPDGDWVAGLRMRVAGQGAPNAPQELFVEAQIEVTAPGREELERGGWLRRVSVERLKSARSTHRLMHEVAGELGLSTAQLHDNWEHGPERMYLTTGGVYLSDFNRDGIPDVLINDVGMPDGYALYRGTPQGKLVDVTREVGLPRARPVMLAAFADLDDDGWEDLILGPGLIFRNVLGRRFQHVGSASNLPAVARLEGLQGQSGIAPADYDGDGRIDLYIFRSTTRPREGSWVAGKIGDRYENQLLRNLGQWRFEDVTAQTATGGGKRSVFSAVWMDANNDGRPDIYAIHEFGNGVLLVNRPDGPFETHEFSDGPSDFGSMGVTCGDVNNDGGIDVYVSSMYSTAGNRVIGNLRPGVYPEELTLQLKRMVAGSQLYVNGGDLRFDRVGETRDVAKVGWSYGPTLVDLDNDGWLDLHVPAGFISRTRAKPDG